VEAFVSDWGYLGVFLGIIATGLGFPMPEELPVVIGGGLAGGFSDSDSEHVIHWWIMLPVCIVGVVIGDTCLYCIGRFWGRKLVNSEYVKKRLLPPERFASIQENFQLYGIKILLFARLTPGIRAPIFLTAGITHLPFLRFLLADGIYAIPGVGLLFTLGYFFMDRTIAIIKNNVWVKEVIILTLIVGTAGYFLYRFFRKPNVTGDPHEVPKIMEPVERTLETITTPLQASVPELPCTEPTNGSKTPVASSPESSQHPAT
jgi:membrane protein DedA with SNARE-associated domain